MIYEQKLGYRYIAPLQNSQFEGRGRKWREAMSPNSTSSFMVNINWEIFLTIWFRPDFIRSWLSFVDAIFRSFHLALRIRWPFSVVMNFYFKYIYILLNISLWRRNYTRRIYLQRRLYLMKFMFWYILVLCIIFFKCKCEYKSKMGVWYVCKFSRS